MFRPKKPEIPATHRLPKQQTVTEETLQFLLSEANQRRGTTLELPIQSHGGAPFMITIKIGDDGGEPMWTYYRGDDERAQVLWRHPTGDVNLVFNLCSVQAGGSESYTATSHNPSAPVMPTPSPTVQQPAVISNSTTTVDLHGTGPSGTLRNLTPVSQQNPNVITLGKQATMQGDLSNMQIPTLLQSIQMSKMTGALQLEASGSQAQIFFEDGNLTHALTAETKGDQAVVELITWEEGVFAFYPTEKSPEKTVKRRVDGLLMEGITLLDQNKYCKERGLKLQSYIIRKNPNLSEDEFRTVLASKGAPLDMGLQKKFYSQIDGSSTLLDILRRMPMIKNEWVPLMFNMMTCGFVVLSDTPPAGASVAPVLNIPPFEIDRTAIQGVIKQITRPETGILTYPMFMYLLELEFAKCAALGMPLSVLIFEPHLRVGENMQSLPAQFVRELLRRLEQFKRPFDGLGHFEMFDYAMFMPNTPVKSAKVFAVRMMEIFGSDPFIPRPMGQLALYTGIAAAPEDTQELSMVLAAAKDAKRRAKETGNLITTFRENPTR